MIVIDENVQMRSIQRHGREYLAVDAERGHVVMRLLGRLGE